jgi:hypothetical protein
LNRRLNFRGLNPKSFDGRGNYNMGLTEQIVFPEIDFEKVTVELTNLTADLDLYANKGQKPTISSFECRPYNRGTSLETCTLWYLLRLVYH